MQGEMKRRLAQKKEKESELNCHFMGTYDTQTTLIQQNAVKTKPERPKT